MKFSLAVLAALVAVCSVEGAIVTLPVEVSAYGYLSKSYDFDGDGIDDLGFGGGGTRCTTDIPVSGCTSSLAILGSERIEFLLDGAIDNFGMPLSNGFVLDSDPAGGIWGTPNRDRLGLSLMTSQRFPDREPYRPELMGLEQYLVGFRLQDSDGRYRYGWIEIRLYGDVIDLDGTVLGQWPSLYARELHLEELADVPVTVVPEPRVLEIMALALATFAARRKRKENPAPSRF